MSVEGEIYLKIPNFPAEIKKIQKVRDPLPVHDPKNTKTIWKFLFWKKTPKQVRKEDEISAFLQFF
jgi:hypothetical protein